MLTLIITSCFHSRLLIQWHICKERERYSVGSITFWVKHFLLWLLQQGNMKFHLLHLSSIRYIMFLDKILSSCRAQQQQEVLAWLLEPLSQQWIQSEWQNCYLSDPMGLVRLCSNTPFMWSLFHTVTFFEKALKRSGHRKSNLNTTSVTSQDLHPMAHHLSWMLPPLLKVCTSPFKTLTPMVRIFLQRLT